MNRYSVTVEFTVEGETAEDAENLLMAELISATQERALSADFGIVGPTVEEP